MPVRLDPFQNIVGVHWGDDDEPEIPAWLITSGSYRTVTELVSNETQDGVDGGTYVFPPPGTSVRGTTTNRSTVYPQDTFPAFGSVNSNFQNFSAFNASGQAMTLAGPPVVSSIPDIVAESPVSGLDPNNDEIAPTDGLWTGLGGVYSPLWPNFKTGRAQILNALPTVELLGRYRPLGQDEHHWVDVYVLNGGHATLQLYDACPGDVTYGGVTFSVVACRVDKVNITARYRFSISCLLAPVGGP